MGDPQPLDPDAMVELITGVDPETLRALDWGKKNQQRARDVQQQLMHGGLDPAYITQMEAFEGVPHAEIHANAQAMMPGNMHHVADEWVDIGQGLDTRILALFIKINKTIADGIEGKTADAASAAAKKFIDQATDVREVVESVGRRIKAAAYAAETVKRSVPPVPTRVAGAPVEGATIGTVPLSGLPVPTDDATFQALLDEEHQTAVTVMNTIYKPAYKPAGDDVPTFVAPDTPGDGWDGGVPGTGGPNGAGTPNESGVPGAENNSEEDPGANSETGSEDQQTTTAGQETSDSGTSTSPSTDTPETTDKPSTSTTAAGVPTGTSPGPGTTTGAPGSGITTGTPPGPQGTTGVPPGPGRSIPGVLPNVGNPAVAAALSGAPARAGVGGMPGMMPPGAGRKDDSESEHKIPDYLIRQREEELLGERPPTVPSVIGADAPAAHSGSDGDRR